MGGGPAGTEGLGLAGPALARKPCVCLLCGQVSRHQLRSRPLASPPPPCPVSTVFTLTRIRNAHVISHLQLSKQDPEAQVGSSCADAAWGVRTGALQPASPRARQPCREPWLLPAGWPRLQPRWLPGSGGGAGISCFADSPLSHCPLGRPPPTLGLWGPGFWTAARPPGGLEPGPGHAPCGRSAGLT